MIGFCTFNVIFVMCIYFFLALPYWLFRLEFSEGSIMGKKYIIMAGYWHGTGHIKTIMSPLPVELVHLRFTIGVQGDILSKIYMFNCL